MTVTSTAPRRKTTTTEVAKTKKWSKMSMRKRFETGRKKRTRQMKQQKRRKY